MYFMNETPQSSFINPAFGTKLGNYISLPALSGIDFTFNTSGFSYHNIIHKHPVYTDSLQVDAEGFFNKLKSSNYLNTQFNTNLFGIGFTFGRNHISFDLNLSMNTRLGLEKSLIGFILYGTENENKGLIYDEPLLNADIYFSPSISFAHDFGDKLTVGTRVGMLFGWLDITSKKTEVSAISENGTLQIQSNIDVLTSNAIGKLSSTSFLNDAIDFTTNGVSQMFSDSFKNRGGVIDLGATYKINDNMQVSAAVTDLGFIRWRTNSTAIRSSHPNHSVEFNGISSTLDSLSNDLEAYVEQLGDTLNYIFDMKTEDIDSYVSMIPTKLYLGYTWQFIPSMYLHALYKGIGGNGYWDSYFSLYYSLHWKALALSVGNTFSKGTALNPSFAFSVTGGGFNLYLGGSFAANKVSFNVGDFTGANVFLGINIMIGSRRPYWTSNPEIPVL
jgi:hypothetical protein